MRNDEILKKTQEGVKESNKILIHELISDLETKGIAPVISIDGNVKKLRLKTIHESEIEAFERELRRFSFDKNDFCLLEADQTNWTKGGATHLHGVVVVVHKKSCKLREYRADNASHWVEDFHRDLASGFFSENLS